MDKKIKKTGAKEEEKKDLPGYPHYPSKDDIYNRDKEEDLKEEDPAVKGLDVPGAELDDADEEIGEEDEENNYYSLGGDNHEDLEEDKGE